MSDATATSQPHEHPTVRTGLLFWWLLALTLAEVGVTYIPMSTLSLAILLIGMAGAKAAIVMIWFMHLRFEKKTVWLIASAPIILGVILAIGLAPEASFVKRWEKPTADLVQHRSAD